MKNIIVTMILLIHISVVAQIKGNKNIVTKTYEVSNIEHIVLDMYAELIIDGSAEENLTITIDENLLNLVDTRVKNGTIRINQLKWISPSQRIKISIGAHHLKKLEIDTYETVLLKNMNSDELELIASLGKIKANGNVKSLLINSTNGNVDASNLIVDNADVYITGKGRVTLNVNEKLKSEVSEYGILDLVHQPKTKNIKHQKIAQEKQFQPNINLKWINLKIKNNSWNRNKFVVIGPKKDGGHFSYGFAMFPGTTKTERLSIGTKIYKDKGAGVKEYLVTVQEANKNSVLKLFER